MMSEGKLEELIKEKRAFLRQTMKDYSSGGNDMLDDVEAALSEAKAELVQRLEVAACLKEDEGEKAWQKECAEIFNAWFEKWFGSASPTS
jgi:hypothetical protein